MERIVIEEKMARLKAASEAYTLDDLTLDLCKVYNLLHPEGVTDSNTKAGDVGLATYSKQPKKKCNACGKWGHIARFCRNKGNQGSQGYSQKSQGNRQGGENPHKNLECGYCHKKGHIKKNCFKVYAHNKFFLTH